MAQRKTDRRTIMTKNMVKDALLELLRSVGYDKITVSALAREAQITRTTFYLHYPNIDAVLDEALDDALRLTELDDNSGQRASGDARAESAMQDIDALLPACQRVASSPKYRVLFMNETTSQIILEKLYWRERSTRIPKIMIARHVSEWEADIIFRYMLYGNFAVNKALKWERNDDWYRAQKVIQNLTAPKTPRNASAASKS